MSEAALPEPLEPLGPAAHKGDAGRVLCLVGSRTMPGAAILVARSAQRAGAGLVILGCLDEGMFASVPPAAPEAVLADLTDAAALEGDLPALLAARSPHARLAGPGLGDDARTRSVLRTLLTRGDATPLVLDADALNALDGEPQLVLGAAGAVVLTPHPGEAARLLRRPIPPDDGGRLEAARELARRFGAVCCLKGRGTVVTDGERTFVNPTGNPGLATAGAGDVLAGILVAYLARRVAGGDPTGGAFETACLAVHTHGLAADHAAALVGADALIASDLVAFLPQAQRRIEGDTRIDLAP